MDIIPVLEDIMNRVYRILPHVESGWEREPVPLYIPWSVDTEYGRQFVYAQPGARGGPFPQLKPYVIWIGLTVTDPYDIVISLFPSRGCFALSL